jgi:hypothetical protein
MPGCCLSQQGKAPVFPHGVEALQGLMDRSPRGGDLVILCMAGAQQGLKGGGLGWSWHPGEGGYPGELRDRLWAGVWYSLVVGILVVMDPVAQPSCGYPSVV